MTVEAASVSGNYDGILAVNTGSGVTSVHASGDVEGTNGNGIMAAIAKSVTFATDGSVAGATGGTNTTDLIVQSDARVSGATYGIPTTCSSVAVSLLMRTRWSSTLIRLMRERGGTQSARAACRSGYPLDFGRQRAMRNIEGHA